MFRLDWRFSKGVSTVPSSVASFAPQVGGGCFTPLNIISVGPQAVAVREAFKNWLVLSVLTASVGNCDIGKEL